MSLLSDVNSHVQEFVAQEVVRFHAQRNLLRFAQIDVAPIETLLLQSAQHCQVSKRRPALDICATAARIAISDQKRRQFTAARRDYFLGMLSKVSLA